MASLGKYELAKIAHILLFHLVIGNDEMTLRLRI